MSLLLVIAVVWVAIAAFTMALLRMAAIADADQERARRERMSFAGDRFDGPARASHRVAGARERSAAGR